MASQINIVMVAVIMVITTSFCLTLNLEAEMKEEITGLKAKVKLLTSQIRLCSRNYKGNFDMTLHNLKTNQVTCNDGTPAGYYLKKSPGSKRWLIYLEGGWYCFDETSCEARKRSLLETLMTSSGQGQRKRGSGILSPDPQENPHWWNANLVYIPYCSSDVWSGNVTKEDTNGKYSFQGVRIIDQVIADLLPKGLYHANDLLLAGSSAGGIGVILNLDRVAQNLARLGSKIQVRGLADSGWYLDSSTQTNGPTETIKKGIRYWKGVVPEACAATQQPEDSWKCYFGNVAYRTLKTPLFVFQWLYDEAQLAVDKIGISTPKDITQEQVRYIMKLGESLRHSLKETSVHAVFSPSCLSHTVLTQSNWLRVKIKGQTLSDTIECWYRSHHHRQPSHDEDSFADGQQRKRVNDGKRYDRVRLGHSSCKKHLIDDCPFPLCNPNCPQPIHPITGDPIKIGDTTNGAGYPINLTDNEFPVTGNGEKDGQGSNT